MKAKNSATLTTAFSGRGKNLLRSVRQFTIVGQKSNHGSPATIQLVKIAIRCIPLPCQYTTNLVFICRGDPPTAQQQIPYESFGEALRNLGDRLLAGARFVVSCNSSWRSCMGVLSFLPVSFVWRQSQPHARMLLHSATKSSLLSCYCLREKELAQVVQEAREIRPAHPISLAVSLLERRLENVVYRMGFAESIPQARALVRQGHILLNRHLPKNAGIALWPGDVVHYTLDPYNASSTAHLPKRLLPSYLQYLNPHTTDRGMMLSLPTLADCPQQLLKTSAVCSGAVAY